MSRSSRIVKGSAGEGAPELAAGADVGADLSGTPVQSSEELLTMAQQFLELSDAELAALFRVDKAAMEQWRRHGVPKTHGERLRRLHETVLALRSHGRERSVAELARLPLPEQAGGTILDLLAAEDIDIERVEGAVEAVQSTASSRTSSELQAEGTVGQLMEARVVTVDAADPVHEAARRMRAADIGDVIVIERGRLQGVLTDRDIVVRVVAEDRDPEVTVCGQVSSRDVHSVTTSTPLAEALALMRRHALRRLPVLDDGRVTGVISLADIAIDRDPESVLASISGATSSD